MIFPVSFYILLAIAGCNNCRCCWINFAAALNVLKKFVCAGVNQAAAVKPGARERASEPYKSQLMSSQRLPGSPTAK